MVGHASSRTDQHPTIHQPDITLILDDAGVIQRASLANDLPAEGMQAWLGRPWSDTVGAGGSDKVRNMLDDALTRGVSAFRLVTQRFPNGLELPVEYSTIRLGGKSGLIAIGKNQQAVADLQGKLIATQQAREQDYWKLREVETRYRLLFDTSHEVVLLIRADNLRVVEANIAALRALNLAPGQDILPEVAANERPVFEAMLTRVREQGRAPGVVLHMGPQREAWLIRASLMASDPGQVFMLQLAPAGMIGAVVPVVLPVAELAPPPTDDLVERLPDAFVIVDPEGTVLRANAAFLDLVQAGSFGMVVGTSLGRWLQSPGADLSVLLTTLQRHRTVRLLATRLHCETGEEIEVEISAVVGGEATAHSIAVVLRDVSRRVAVSPLEMRPKGPVAGVHAAIDAMEGRIGQMPLPQLVRDMVDVMERHFIEATLVRSGGNRTMTAETLGLSRQSLYVKLKKYDLAAESQAEAEPSL